MAPYLYRTLLYMYIEKIGIPDFFGLVKHINLTAKRREVKKHV